MRNETRFITRASVVITLLSTWAACGTVRYVAPGGPGPGGQSWGSAYPSIQLAIEDSAIHSGDEIHVKCGDYIPDFTINVNKAVQILGGFSGDGETRDPSTYVTTISGGDVTNCMTVSANARIDGITFTEGYSGGPLSAEDRGSGLYISGCGPTITNCTFTLNRTANRGGAISTLNATGTMITGCTFSGNRAGLYGGAISNQGSNVTISGCTFNENQSNDTVQYLGGGAIFNDTCSPTVTQCTFSGNYAYYGAGICNYCADAIITECTFTDCNSETAGGGGIMNYNCSATISRCLFTSNIACRGGAVFDESTSTIANCVMWNNSAGGVGGAIHLEPSDIAVTQPTITNCTIYGNAASYGGGLYAQSATASLRNCILWNNRAYFSGPSIYQLVTLDVQYCDVQGDTTFPGTGNIRAEPAFANGDGGDFELTWGSPCVDKGSNTAPGVGSVDYAGKPRVVDGDENHVAVVDMGALEYRGRYINDYLSYVEITQNRVYSSPDDSSPDHVFRLVVKTGHTIAQISFHTPGGYDYTITNVPHATLSSCTETYHSVDGAFDVWEYRGTFPSFPLLGDYGDGLYTLTALYNDGTSQQATFWYGIPGTTQTLTQPTQKPNILSPSYGGRVASPVVLTWDACTDAGANSIYVETLDSNGDPLASETLSVSATQNTGLSLKEGVYDAEIAFQNHYDLTTSDGIPFVYGKAVVVPYQFEVFCSTVYRFWSPSSDLHFYTINAKEKKKIIDTYPPSVWTYEGPAYNACSTVYCDHLVPVYRFWAPGNNTHFYTIKEAEKNKLVQTMADVWTFEGVAFYAYAPESQPAECVPVYRFWNASASTHFYTIKEAEKNKLINQDGPYAYEGIAFYVYSL